MEVVDCRIMKRSALITVSDTAVIKATRKMLNSGAHGRTIRFDDGLNYASNEPLIKARAFSDAGRSKNFVADTCSAT